MGRSRPSSDGRQAEVDLRHMHDRQFNRPDLCKRPAWLSLALGFVVAIACVARFQGLDVSPIELDESLQFRLSRLGMKGVIAYHERFPQHYLIDFGAYHWFQNLGLRYIDPGLLGIRLPNALAGVLVIVLLYRLGADVWNHRTGLLAAGMLSVSTIHIRVSRWGRGYSLVGLLIFVSIYAFVRCITVERTRDRVSFLSLWILSTFLACISINYSYFILFAQGLFILRLLLKSKTRSLGRFLCSGGIAIVLLCSPFLCHQLTTAFSSPLNYGAFDRRAETQILERNLEMLEPVLHEFWPLWPLAVTLVLIVLGLRLSTIRDAQARTVCLVCLLVPYVLAFVGAVLVKAVMEADRIVYLLPLYLVLVAAGLEYISGKLESMRGRVRPVPWFCLAVLGLILTQGLIHAKDFLRGQIVEPNGFSAAARFLMKQRSPGDFLVWAESMQHDQDPFDYTLERMGYQLRGTRDFLSLDEIHLWQIGITDSLPRSSLLRLGRNPETFHSAGIRLWRSSLDRHFIEVNLRPLTPIFNGDSSQGLEGWTLHTSGPGLLKQAPESASTRMTGALQLSLGQEAGYVRIESPLFVVNADGPVLGLTWRQRALGFPPGPEHAIMASVRYLDENGKTLGERRLALRPHFLARDTSTGWTPVQGLGPTIAGATFGQLHLLLRPGGSTESVCAFFFDDLAVHGRRVDPGVWNNPSPLLRAEMAKRAVADAGNLEALVQRHEGRLPNRLANGDFEDGFEGWTRLSNFAVLATPGLRSRTAVLVTASRDPKDSDFYKLRQKVLVEPGHMYLVGASLRTRKFRGFGATVEIQDLAGTERPAWRAGNRLSGTQDWTVVALLFQAPSETREVWFFAPRIPGFEAGEVEVDRAFFWELPSYESDP